MHREFCIRLNDVLIDARALQIIHDGGQREAWENVVLSVESLARRLSEQQGEVFGHWIPNARACSDGTYEDGPGELVLAQAASDSVRAHGTKLYTHHQPAAGDVTEFMRDLCELDPGDPEIPSKTLIVNIEDVRAIAERYVRPAAGDGGRIVGSRQVNGVHVIVAKPFSSPIDEQLLVRYDDYLAATAAGDAVRALAEQMQRELAEDKAWDYMARLHKNISAYPRSGEAPIKAVSRGEAAVGIVFIALGPGEKAQGFPTETLTPAEGTGAEIGAMSIIKGGPNPNAAEASRPA